MGHYGDHELLELIGDALSPEERRRVEEHLAGCQEGRRRRDALREIWNALGEWKLPKRSVDLWPRVETAVSRLEGQLDLSEYGRRRGDALRRLWAVLEEWKLPRRRPDLWADIEEAVRGEVDLSRRAAARRGLWRVLRVAAAVLLSAVVGHGLGRWVASRTTRVVPAENMERAAVEALHLDALAVASPAGLAESILSIDATAGEEVSR